MAGLWADKKRPAVRLDLLTAGNYYINAAATSALDPNGTKFLSGIASAPELTALDLKPFGRPRLPPASHPLWILCLLVKF